MVFAGKMSYHANATAARFFAQEILPRVRLRRPGARLYIVGSDPPADVRALAALPGVVVTGYVPDVRAYLLRASVAVAPMVVKVGVQNKILEAMATATPVVTSRAGAEGLDARPGDEMRVADGGRRSPSGRRPARGCRRASSARVGRSRATPSGATPGRRPAGSSRTSTGPRSRPGGLRRRRFGRCRLRRPGWLEGR